MIEMLFKMLVGHAIADYWALTDYMYLARNRHSDLSKFYGKGQNIPTVWPYALAAHAMIHGGAVWWITGSFGLFLAETLAHALIDFGKCEGWFGFHTDQALHFACKMLWCIIFFYF